MKSNTVFIPGKVLLSGEHSVVYGEPALAASIDLGVRASVSQYHSVTMRLDDDGKGLITKAIALAGGDPDTLGVTIDSSLPVGSGLGSSAAVAASVIKAVRLFLDIPIENEELFSLTMECEKIAHGNPSGVDPAAVIFGGLVWYIKGKPIDRFAIKHPTKLLLINSGKPSESTKEMIELVASKDKRLIQNIGMVTREMKRVLESGEDMTPVMNKNGRLLEELGIVGGRATSLSQQLRDLGAGVKVTGAGGVKDGSGMMLVYHTCLSEIVSFLEQKKISYYEVTVG